MVLFTLFSTVLSAQQFSVQSPPCNLFSLITIGLAIGFRARDINFFDLDSTKEAIEIKNNYRLYHNVYSFIYREFKQ